MPLTVQQIMLAIVERVRQGDGDYRSMAASMLREEGFALTEEGAVLNARHADGRGLAITFDAQGRIARMAEVKN